MGADFQSQLKLPPKLFLVGTRLGSWIARRAGGSLALQLRGPRPYAHSRVITAAQVGVDWVGGVMCLGVGLFGGMGERTAVSSSKVGGRVRSGNVRGEGRRHALQEYWGVRVGV